MSVAAQRLFSVSKAVIEAAGLIVADAYLAYLDLAYLHSANHDDW
jgi:hypothetical protein